MALQLREEQKAIDSKMLSISHKLCEQPMSRFLRMNLVSAFASASEVLKLPANALT
jgi:hypothetical protein